MFDGPQDGRLLISGKYVTSVIVEEWYICGFTSLRRALCPPRCTEPGRPRTRGPSTKQKFILRITIGFDTMKLLEMAPV